MIDPYDIFFIGVGTVGASLFFPVAKAKAQQWVEDVIYTGKKRRKDREREEIEARQQEELLQEQHRISIADAKAKAAVAEARAEIVRNAAAEAILNKNMNEFPALMGAIEQNKVSYENNQSYSSRR